MKYPNLSTAIRPVPHSVRIPVPVFKGYFIETLDPVPVFKAFIYDTLTPDAYVNMDPDFDPADPAMSPSWQSVSGNPECFNQKELIDQISNMNLRKENLILLASRLREKKP